MVKKFATLACGAVVAFGLMACHHNDIGNGSSAAVTEDVDVTSNVKTLIVKLSRALKAGETLKYNGATGVVSADGKTVTFEGVADGKTLVLTGGNLVDQSTTINFGDGDVVAIDLDVLEEAEEYDWNTYTEGDDAKAEDELGGATASVTVKASTIGSIKNNKFSITLYTPAVSPLTEIKTGAAETALLAAKCKPVGAKFNPAVGFEANLPGAAGCDIVCYNVNSGSTKWPVSASEATKLTAELSAFTSTDPVISLKYNITSIDEDKVLIASGTVPAGQNVISYKKKYGYESVTTTTGVIARLFRQLFGTALGETTKSFGIETEGETTYELYQNVKTVTITSGTAEFKVRMYGEVTANFISVVTPEEPEIVPTHNGGSND